MKYVFLFIFTFLSMSCSSQKKWKLSWSEEFNYQGTPDSLIWNFDTKGNEWGWGNNELQYYTTKNQSNAIVENGILKIIAKKEILNNKEYSSARLTTKDKVSFKEGRIEIRAKLPLGRGIWPAIWMLGNNIETVGWPLCGEIDIMEFVGYQTDSIYATIHSEAYNHIKNTEKMKSTYFSNPHSFNVFAIEWTKDKIDFFFNETLYNSVQNEYVSNREWPFDKSFYLILNVAVGGNWGGKFGVDSAIFPATMEVDYVRLFLKK